MAIRELQEAKPVKEGLICMLSCVEPCVTFTVRRDREKGQLRLLPRNAMVSDMPLFADLHLLPSKGRPPSGRGAF